MYQEANHGSQEGSLRLISPSGSQEGSLRLILLPFWLSGGLSAPHSSSPARLSGGLSAPHSSLLLGSQEGSLRRVIPVLP